MGSFKVCDSKFSIILNINNTPRRRCRHCGEGVDVQDKRFEVRRCRQESELDCVNRWVASEGGM